MTTTTTRLRLIDKHTFPSITICNLNRQFTNRKMPEFKNFSDFLGKLKKKFNEFFTTYFGIIFIFVLVSYLRILKYRDNLHVQFLYLENLSLKIFLLEKQRLNKLQVFLVYMIGMGVNDDGKCSDGDQTCSLGSEIKYFSNIFFLESNSIKIFR